MGSGKLFVCATPIGNLEDVTLRVLRVLGEVDLIAAEDTRITRKLLNKYEIKTRLESYHEHNERKKGKELIERLENGLDLALVSDAGMPGLSDPGFRLIKSCIDCGIDIEVLPGPFAAITALVASGLPTDSFVFQGFLPRKSSQRRKILSGLASEERTLVFYESCHRISGFLKDASEVLGDRQAVLGRELTKKFEEIIRGDIGRLLTLSEQKELKGEIVAIIAGAPKHQVFLNPDGIRKLLEALVIKGFSKKDATKHLSQETGIPKRAIYEIAQTLSAKKPTRKSKPC